MNLYKVTDTTDRQDFYYYTSMIVSAESKSAARRIHPDSDLYSSDDSWGGSHEWVDYDKIDSLEVELIGVSKIEKGVVLTSGFTTG